MFSQKENGLPAIPILSGRQLQAGQILLIVILVVIIASTIGLSLASRSITSIRTSTEEAESQKALAAAEAGIERAIQSSVPIAVVGNNPSNNSSYNTSVGAVDGSSFLINGGNIIPKDEGADVWFVSHNDDGTLDYDPNLSLDFLNLYWGLSSEECNTRTVPAAIQAIVVARKSETEIKTYRYAYDSCSRGNNFTLPSTGSFNIGGTTFENRTLQGSDNDLAKTVTGIVFMRVIPIYKDAVIGVSACDHEGQNCTSLPSQGYKISSSGISGQANRKITVFKGYPQTYLPYLSYGLFVAK